MVLEDTIDLILEITGMQGVRVVKIARSWYSPANLLEVAHLCKDVLKTGAIKWC